MDDSLSDLVVERQFPLEELQLHLGEACRGEGLCDPLLGRRKSKVWGRGTLFV